MPDMKLGELSEEDAREICTWRYPGKYSIYNLSDWDTVVRKGWDLAQPEKRSREFVAILLEGHLLGYGRIKKERNIVFLGIGLRPGRCSKGYGKKAMKLLVEEAGRRYPGCQVALEVRTFNLRAISCYQDVGFAIKDRYQKDTLNGGGIFYLMEYI
ncbi:MAG: GNAT family N-acetyltransferase [Halanaerobium sp.]|nr:GNAT family N-acetyltransferase [Halanaerobium sp.]